MTNPGGEEPVAGAYEAPPIEASQQPPGYAPPPPPQYAPPAYPPPPGAAPGYPPPPGVAPGYPPPPATYPPPPQFGGPAGYGPGNAFGAPQGGTNNMAIASLVLSAIGIFCGFGSIAGIVVGIIALNQMKQSGSDAGRGLAIAGIAVGAVTLVLGGIFYASVLRF